MNDSSKIVLFDGGQFTTIDSNAGKTRFIYNLLPIGKFYDKRYGEIIIDDKLIQEIVKNFGKYPAYKVPVKIGHEQGAISPGEIITVRGAPEGLEITIVVDSETSQAILNEQYRYMSAEFDSNYLDKETGKFVGAVLLGAALVNQPANPYMQPLIFVDDLDTQEGEQNMSTTRDDDLEAKVKELEAKIAELEVANEALQKEREKAESDKNSTDVKLFCDKWISQGIPPVIVEKIKPLLLSKIGRVIKLSDNVEEDVPSLKFFDELFENFPKVNLKQIGSSNNSTQNFSDIDVARKRGETIAASIKF